MTEIKSFQKGDPETTASLRTIAGRIGSHNNQTHMSDAEILAIENRQKAAAISSKIRKLAHTVEWRDLRAWDAERIAALKLAAHYDEINRSRLQKAL